MAWAALVAASAVTEIVVVVGYEQPITMRGRGAAYIESVRVDLEHEAVELAEEAVALLTSRGLSARGVVIKGDVPHALLDVAESEECDLIVIGRQGISSEAGGVSGALDRMRDLLQGGVSSKVVRHASVPILVVP
ncbi:MAG: universal stress protein [Nocardioides sp.]